MAVPFHFFYEEPQNHLALKEYIYKIGTFHYHWHRDLELLLLLKGEVELLNNGVRTILRPGDLGLVNPGIGHATLAREPKSIALLFRLDPVFFSDSGPGCQNMTFTLNSRMYPEQSTWYPVFRRDMAAMMLAMVKRDKMDKIAFFQSFYDVLFLLTRYYKDPDPEEKKRTQKTVEKLRMATDFIDAHYMEKLTLTETAERIGYSTNYLSQLFKKEIGVNFYEYVTRKRLREATRELDRTTKKILEVATDNGFQNLKSFNVKFKEVFGRTPSQYRELLEDIEVRDVKDYHVRYIDQSNKEIWSILERYSTYGEAEKTPAEERQGQSFPEREEIQALARILLNRTEELRKQTRNFYEKVCPESEKSTRS